MNKLFLFLFIIIGRDMYSQIFYESILDEYVLENPAYFVNDDSYHFSLLRAQQWNNISSNNTFFVQKSIENLNLGAVFFVNRESVAKIEQAVSIPISYQLNFSKSKLSFGLNPLFKHTQLNGESLNPLNSGDPFFEPSSFNQFLLGGGIYFKSEKIKLGVSRTDLLFKTNHNRNPTNSLLFGVKLKLSDRIGYEPLIRVRTNSQVRFNWSLVNRLVYDDLVAVLITNESNQRLSLGTQLFLKKIFPRLFHDIRFLYSYGTHFGGLNVLGGIHQIGFTYRWLKLPNVKKIEKTIPDQSPVFFE